VTHTKYIHAARTEWEKRTNNAIVDYIVVSRLPKNAIVEWHLWAHRHNARFECKYVYEMIYHTCLTPCFL